MMAAAEQDRRLSEDLLEHIRSLPHGDKIDQCQQCGPSNGDGQRAGARQAEEQQEDAEVAEVHEDEHDDGAGTVAGDSEPAQQGSRGERVEQRLQCEDDRVDVDEAACSNERVGFVRGSARERDCSA